MSQAKLSIPPLSANEQLSEANSLKKIKALFTPGQVLPDQTAVDEALKKFADSNKWEIVTYLSGQNPSTDAVTYAIVKATGEHNLSVIRKLWANNEPDVNILNSVLILACEQTKPFKDIVRYVCTLKEPSAHPDKKGISEALQKAVGNKHWELVEYFCDMQGANQPDLEELNYALEEAAKIPQLNVVKTLLKISISKETLDWSKAIIAANTAANNTAKNNDDHYKMAKFLWNKAPTLTNAASLNPIIIDFVGRRDWDLLERIYKQPQEFQLDRDTISSLLNAAIKQAQSVDKIKKISEHFKPDSEALGQALIEAAQSHHGASIIEYLCQDPSLLEDEDIDLALVKAAESKNWDSLKSLFGMHRETQPPVTTLKEIEDLAKKAGKTKIEAFCREKITIIEALKKLKIEASPLKKPKEQEISETDSEIEEDLLIQEQLPQQPEDVLVVNEAESIAVQSQATSPEISKRKVAKELFPAEESPLEISLKDKQEPVINPAPQISTVKVETTQIQQSTQIAQPANPPVNPTAPVVLVQPENPAKEKQAIQQKSPIDETKKTEIQSTAAPKPIETIKAAPAKNVEKPALASKNVKSSTIQLYVLSGFMTVLGIAAIALAFALLSAATGAMAGVALATTGAAVASAGVALLAHSFFRKPPITEATKAVDKDLGAAPAPAL